MELVEVLAVLHEVGVGDGDNRGALEGLLDLEENVPAVDQGAKHGLARAEVIGGKGVASEKMRRRISREGAGKRGRVEIEGRNRLLSSRLMKKSEVPI